MSALGSVNDVMAMQNVHSPQMSRLERVPNVPSILFWMLKHAKMVCMRSNS